MHAITKEVSVICCSWMRLISFVCLEYFSPFTMVVELIYLEGWCLKMLKFLQKKLHLQYNASIIILYMYV